MKNITTEDLKVLYEKFYIFTNEKMSAEYNGKPNVCVIQNNGYLSGGYYIDNGCLDIEWEISIESLCEFLENRAKIARDERYEQYLKLKAEFEPNLLNNSTDVKFFPIGSSINNTNA